MSLFISMTAQTTAILLLLIAHATAAFAQVSVAELRTALIESQGNDYVALRTSAIDLPASDFADLIALLELAEPVSEDRLIAAALRVRREHPAVAAEFDERLQVSIENPEPGRGGKIYRAWWPRDRLDVDPLAFEAYLKLELPMGLSQSIRDFMHRPNPENANALLVVAKVKGADHVSYLATAIGAQVEEQIRVTPLVVQLHKYWREQGQQTEAAVHLLAGFGTQHQLDALNEIRTFEQQLLPLEGFTPWADQGWKENAMAALRQERLAKEALYQAQLEGQPQSVIAALEATVEQRKQDVITAQRRLYAKVSWDQLELAIARLNAQLNPEP